MDHMVKVRALQAEETGQTKAQRPTRLIELELKVVRREERDVAGKGDSSQDGRVLGALQRPWVYLGMT